VQAYAEKAFLESRKEKARITIHQTGGTWHFELGLPVSTNQGASTAKLSAQALLLFGDPKIFKDADAPMVPGTKIRGWQAVILDVVTADSAVCMVDCKVPPSIASALDGTVIEDVTLRVSEKDLVAGRQSRAICAIHGAMEYENGTLDNARDGKDTLNWDLNVKVKLLCWGEPVDSRLVNILGKDVVIPADCPLNGEQLEGIRNSCNTAPGGLMLIQGP
jgi:hypothetical protein